MNRFIESHAIALTPLTPIHIGCGEDFEPTNYVIDNGILYHFDPALVPLTEVDRKALLQAVARPGDEAIRAVQAFFYGKRSQCIEASRLRVPVAEGVAEWYESRVGKVAQREERGRTISNQLEIERTAHHPHTGRAYLPGSSLKGAIRTAWLNQIDPGQTIERDAGQKPRERGSDIETELLGGGFSSDPFRQVKVADAVGPAVTSRVVFSVDRDKQPRLSRTGEQIEKNLFVRREVIVGAQHRALTGEIRFDRLPRVDGARGVPAADKRIGGFAELARACNRFYGARLDSDLALIRRRFADDPWVDEFAHLLAGLRADLESGRVILLRAGRHSGAESITLEKRRWIRILTGKGRQPRWSRDPTTIWLAAERENSVAELLPFGFLVAEPADGAGNEALARWCASESARLSARTSDARRTDVAPGTAVKAAAAPSAEVVWDRARLKFNARNGTLTAVGPGNAEANALAPKGAELLATLPTQMQSKVRANEFVRVAARVVGGELVGVESKP